MHGICNIDTPAKPQVYDMDNRFTTRVVLHGADEDDYEILHESMQSEGFTRTITGEHGIEYHLPEAEYNKTGNFKPEDVRTSAKKAANKTGRKSAILVTASTGSYWTGLDKVKD